MLDQITAQFSSITVPEFHSYMIMSVLVTIILVMFSGAFSVGEDL